MSGRPPILAAYPRLGVLPHRGRDGPSLAAYLALLRLGLAEPRMLPPVRWALTPPFHPYRAVSGEAVCFLLRYPSRKARARRAQALPGNLPYGARTFLGAVVPTVTRRGVSDATVRSASCVVDAVHARKNNSPREVLSEYSRVGSGTAC